MPPVSGVWTAGWWIVTCSMGAPRRLVDGDAGAGSRLIVNPALECAQRHDGQREQERDADHGRCRGNTDVVVLMRLLIDVVEQQRGCIRRSTLRHDDDVV